ncbi:hypothetical protein [Actinopolymorpha pittospori]|uniref:Uncharacterized protein n=1 Tax=Actinopolymorpha pittospori TaxID=648752 RepID=A0A927N6N9_9ACTN|nr:hypothetical protein [Actinopolymorpha pittospori]MBE1609957.1 hypothetical protein [Actinopolymorpha pittospori]
MSTSISSGTDGGEVVKWYTRARRFPQLIGKTPDGATIWGGPYTYTQVIAGVLFIVIGTKTTWLWGHFGLVGNALILLGSAYGLVLVLGRLPIGSRNPLSVGTGVMRAINSPAQGNVGGKPVRIRRPHHIRSTVVITHGGPTLADVQAAHPDLPGAAGAGEHPEVKRCRSRPRGCRPAPAPASTRLRPTPASIRTAPTPALTGVQRLLASVGTPHQKD